MSTNHSTTAMLTTPPGKGGIAVIMLWGQSAGDTLVRVFTPLRSHACAQHGELQLGHLLDRDGQVIDEAIVCASHEAIEINIHGGPHVARAVMKLLEAGGANIVNQSDAAAAGAGLPASHPKLVNPAIGREMLRLLPQARSELVAAVLSQQWSAGLSQLVSELLQRIEAGQALPADAATQLRTAADGLTVAARLINPPEVVLAGPPNAGKSTLANALVGRSVSIVNAMPGTTRDWVRELALLDGVPVWLTDTAGLWDVPVALGAEASRSHAAIDAEAVRRAHSQIAQADLVVLLTQSPDEASPLNAAPVLRVWPKCDAMPPQGRPDVTVSAHTGAGLEELKQAIIRELGMSNIDPAAPRAFTARQANLLNTAGMEAQAGDIQALCRTLDQLLSEELPRTARQS